MLLLGIKPWIKVLKLIYLKVVYICNSMDSQRTNYTQIQKHFFWLKRLTQKLSLCQMNPIIQSELFYQWVAIDLMGGGKAK